MLNRATRYLLAAIQAIVGWEWIVSGSNKVLSGSFPQSLLDTLNTGIQGNPNAWYVSFLQNVIEPHSIFWGYAIEWTEVTIGVVFLTSALILLGRPSTRGEAGHRLASFVEHVGARMPTPDEASLLQLAEGVPVVTVTRVAYREDGRPVEMNDMVLAADRYQLSYEWAAE